MKFISSFLSVIFISLLFVCCVNNDPPSPYPYEKKMKFTWGFVDFWGNYYANYQIPHNITSLHLFSENLFLSDDFELDGTGQYLVIEDIFSDKNAVFLPAGNYTASENEEPFTFYSGKKFIDNRDVIPSGAYVYYIESDPSKSKIAYITSGSFKIDIKNDSIYTIQCDFILDEKTEIKGTFENVLYHLDRTTNNQTENNRTQFFPRLKYPIKQTKD